MDKVRIVGGLVFLLVVCCPAFGQVESPARYAIAVGPVSADPSGGLPWSRPIDVQEAWEERGLPEVGQLVFKIYADDWHAFARAITASDADTETGAEQGQAFVTGDIVFLSALDDFTNRYQLVLLQPIGDAPDAVILASHSRILSGTDVVVSVVDPALPNGGQVQIDWLRRQGYEVDVADLGNALEAMLHLAADRTDIAAVPFLEWERFRSNPKYEAIGRALTVKQRLVSKAQQGIYVANAVLETAPEVAYALRKVLLGLDESLQPQPLAR